MECTYCKKEYKRKTLSYECSLKCKLLLRIKVVGDCWEWQKGIKRGYGIIQHESKTYQAHRASFEVFKGEIPEGKFICHTCDNRKCINPEHLWIGTAKENMQDCSRKGRLVDNTGRKWSKETREKCKYRPHADRKGEKHHLTKLTEEDVLEIREKCKKGVKYKEIALTYGVAVGTIKCIKLRINWAHI